MAYTKEIVELREQIVALSKDPIETRKLLDKLTEAEIDQHDIDTPLIVRNKDVEETKDFEFYSIRRTRNGYLLQYKGGYSIFVDNKMILPCQGMQSLMDGSSMAETPEDKEVIDLTNSAIETIFRLPFFVLSDPATTFNIATMAAMYLNFLQTKGEVPTEDTENPEYDKFLLQMNEMLENFAEGLRKEGEEYERRNGISHEEKSENKGENESQG